MKNHVHQSLDRHGVSRASVAVIVDGHAATYGVGDTATDGSQRVPIFSITKTWIATLVLRAVDQGVLALESSARTWIDILELDSAITVRHLLNHTAGLPDYGGNPSYHRALRDDPGRPWRDNDFLRSTFAGPALFPPGMGWAYSNPGFMLLKDILEAATGRSFDDHVTMLADILGLRATAVVDTLADMAPLMSGLTTALDTDGEVHETAGRYHPGWVAHGLIASTALDTARFLDRLDSGALLSEASNASLLTHVRVPIDQHPVFRQPGYGSGLMIDADTTDYRLVGHGGGGPGFSLGALSMTRRDGRRATAVAFTNRDHAEIGLDLAWELLRTYCLDWPNGTEFLTHASIACTE